MFVYYLDLGWHSIRRSPGLSALIVIALGLGIGASMTSLTLFRVLSSDPLPHKSARLFNVQLDSARSPNADPQHEPNQLLKRLDAEALLRDARGVHQVMMAAGSVMTATEGSSLRATASAARYTSVEFFAMFDAPFADGSAWSRADDASAARVAVISTELSDKLFGAGTRAVGHTVMASGVPFRVVGVLAPWNVFPRFYDIYDRGPFAAADDIYVPIATAIPLGFVIGGAKNCDGPGEDDCDWVQYWVELASPAQAPAYREYLDRYALEQRRIGRFARPPNARVRAVLDWLIHNEVMPRDVKLQTWLALGFLAVCLTNTVGLLLAKCLRRSAEIGIRRALGATRTAIFCQFLVESCALGACGGALGALLAGLGLWFVRQSPNDYAAHAQMDWLMLTLTLLAAVLSSLIAAILPAWQAARVPSALQIKTS